MSKIGKALLSTAMIAATAATFASTTYAFVVLEEEVHVDNIDFDIETHGGLLVSLEPDAYVTATGEDAGITDLKDIADNKLKAKNFYQDISTKMLDPYVTGTVYQGVTMVADETKHPEYADNADLTALAASGLAQNGVKFDALGNLKFVKDSIVPVAEPEKNPYRSDHKLVDADATDYIKLDLSFRLAHQGELDKTYNLVFTTSSITSTHGKADSLELLNSLYTVGKNPDNQTAIEKGNEQNEWRAGETFTVDPVDALRVAIVDRDVYKAQLSAGDPNTALTVLESKNGHGSAAIEGVTSAETPSVFDKEYNAMYTYHNNVHPFEPFTKAATPHCGFDTKKVDFANFNDASNSEAYVLGTFTPQAVTEEDTNNEGDLKKYDDIHLTLYFYLEGWDADFFTGISNKASEFKINLGFKMVEVA